MGTSRRNGSVAAGHPGPSPARPEVPWIGPVWAVNAFFLACTYYATDRPFERVARPFHLGHEQNVAAWWSGVQLLTAALAVHSARLAVGRRDPALSRGLLALTFLMVGLFADEVGSFHERLATAGGDVWLAPFVLLGAAGLIYAVRPVRRVDAATRGAWLLIIGAFVLFALVAAQEWIETHTTIPPWMKPARTVAEEGTELFGFFLLLLAAARLRTGLTPPGAPAPAHVFLPEPGTLRAFLAGAVALAVPAILVRSAFTPEQLVLPRRGDFGFVIPVAGLFLGALAAAHAGLRDAPARRAWWAVGVVLLALSADACAHTHHYVFQLLGSRSAPGEGGLRGWMGRFDPVGWRGETSLLWTVPLLLATAWRVPALRDRRLLLAAWAVFGLAALAVGMSVTPLSIAVAYIIPLGFTARVLHIGQAHAALRERRLSTHTYVPTPLPPTAAAPPQATLTQTRPARAELI